jgi:hypothetical protein
MNFLKNLFGGEGGVQDKRGYYVYVRPKRCDQLLEVRIDLYNDLSLDDDGGYFVRKIAQSARCPFPAEITLNFDKNRSFLKRNIVDGEFVEKSEYEAWNAERQTTNTG